MGYVPYEIILVTIDYPLRILPVTYASPLTITGDAKLHRLAYVPAYFIPGNFL